MAYVIAISTDDNYEYAVGAYATYVRMTNGGLFMSGCADLSEATVFRNSADFDRVKSKTAKGVFVIKVLLFEPHVAQYHLTDLIRL